MEFNGDKFECIKFRVKRNIHEKLEEDHKYVKEKGKEIEEKDHLKDLGVQLSNDLTFSKHIAKTISTCRKTLEWIMRIFKTRSAYTMKTLWN